MQAVRFEVVGQSNIDFENFKPIAHYFVERRRDGVDKRFKDGLLQTTLELASVIVSPYLHNSLFRARKEWVSNSPIISTSKVGAKRFRVPSVRNRERGPNISKIRVFKDGKTDLSVKIFKPMKSLEGGPGEAGQPVGNRPGKFGTMQLVKLVDTVSVKGVGSKSKNFVGKTQFSDLEVRGGGRQTWAT
jgi:hypothetical protein